MTEQHSQMTKTACLHIRNTKNVGDLSCSPGDYFDFGQTEMLDFSQEAGVCDLAILGGGKTLKHCVTASIFKTAQAKHRITWGVGIAQRDTDTAEFDILKGSCDLISTRNWDVENCDFVPCASAMSPLFDHPANPQHEVVLFYHKSKSRHLMKPDGVPNLSNHDCNMREALDFIASGATVVTNSYHGTYWAMCLGRRVLCLPFNRKFKQFRQNPVMSVPDDWLVDVVKAEPRFGTLQEARDRNRAFYEKVRNALPIW